MGLKSPRWFVALPVVYDACDQLLSVRRRLHRASKKIDALESTVSSLKEEGAGLRREIAEGDGERGETTRRLGQKLSCNECSMPVSFHDRDSWPMISSHNRGCTTGDFSATPYRLRLAITRRSAATRL